MLGILVSFNLQLLIKMMVVMVKGESYLVFPVERLGHHA